MHAWITQYFIVTFECSSQRVIVPMTTPAVHLPVCLFLWQAALSHIPPSLICSGPVACKMVWGEFVELCLGSRSDGLSWEERVLSVKPARATWRFLYDAAASVRGRCVYKWYMIYSYDQITLLPMACSSEVYWFHTDNLLLIREGHA